MEQAVVPAAQPETRQAAPRWQTGMRWRRCGVCHEYVEKGRWVGVSEIETGPGTRKEHSVSVMHVGCWERVRSALAKRAS